MPRRREEEVVLPIARRESGPFGGFDPTRPVPMVTAVDIETTGTDPQRHRVVEVAFLTSTGLSFTTLVNPKSKIPAWATAKHGISDADVQRAPTFEEAWDEARRRGVLDGYPTAYFAQFEQRFFAAELTRAERYIDAQGVIDMEWIDTMVLAKLQTGSVTLKLIDACHMFGAPYPGQRSIEQAHSRLHLLYALEHRRPTFTTRPLAEAMGMQVLAGAQQEELWRQVNDLRRGGGPGRR